MSDLTDENARALAECIDLRARLNAAEQIAQAFVAENESLRADLARAADVQRVVATENEKMRAVFSADRALRSHIKNVRSLLP